jgi:hypothetical protein
MPDLAFRVEAAVPVPDAASPHIALALRVTNRTAGERVHGALLRCQVQIEPGRRAHDASTGARVRDLFGPPSEWGKTMRALFWTNASVSVPAFDGDALVDVALPCSTDFALATTVYLHGVEDGEIPLALFFSGTVFHDRNGGAGGEWGVSAAPVSHACEARYGLSPRAWSEAIALHHGEVLPVPLRRDVVTRLLEYKAKRGIATLDRALEALLARAEAD